LLPLRHDLSFENAESYFIEKDEKNGLSEVTSEDSKRLGCKAGKAVCSISPHGEVSPCLLMPIKLGNLREQTMEEIWYQEGNELLDKLRDPTSYELSPCLNCALLPFCNRCPGVAYMETGNPFGRSPSACRYAKWRGKNRMKGGDIQ
jgi:radical SAM protein with 4Fe4S-binding SPASM domain